MGWGEDRAQYLDATKQVQNIGDRSLTSLQTAAVSCLSARARAWPAFLLVHKDPWVLFQPAGPHLQVSQGAKGFPFAVQAICECSQLLCSQVS